MRRYAGLLVLAACTDAEPGETGDGAGADDCAPGPDRTLVIGTGEAAFAPVTDQVELVHGPQGGYHVYVGFDATQLDTSGFALGRIEGTIGGETIAITQPYLDFRCNPATGTLQTWGTILIYPLTPEELDGQETVITASITDIAENVVTATLTTTIEDPTLETP